MKLRGDGAIRKSMSLAEQPWFRQAAQRAWAAGKLKPSAELTRPIVEPLGEWSRQGWWRRAVDRARLGLLRSRL